MLSIPHNAASRELTSLFILSILQEVFEEESSSGKYLFIPTAERLEVPLLVKKAALTEKLARQ